MTRLPTSRRRLPTLAAALAALAALLPSATWALGIRLGNQDATAVARGNAFAATADTPGAIYYNPAGISQLEATQLSLGAYFLSYEVDYHFRSVDSGTESRLWALPQLFLTHHLPNTPLTVGLGSYSGFGLGSNWPEDGPLRSLSTDAELVYSTITPVLSWQVVPGLAVAGGPTFNYGDASFERGVFVGGDSFIFEGDDIAPGYHLGLLWDVNEHHSIGLTYRSSVNLSLRGRAALSTPFPGTFDGSASGDLTLPRQIVVGYSFRPTAKWNFEVDVEWTEWQMFDELKLNTAGGRMREALEWENSVVISVGATRYLSDRAWISVGYWFAEETVPDSTYNPRVPDMNYHVFSIGGGCQVSEHLSIALAYQIGYGPDRDVQGSPASFIGTTADGTYDYLSHAIAVTATWRF